VLFLKKSCGKMGTCLEQYVETFGNDVEKHGQIWKVSGTRGKYVDKKITKSVEHMWKMGHVLI
jgi:hypothetical protein